MQLIAEETITLLDALRKVAPDSSRRTLAQWLRSGRVSVDGRVVRIGSTEVAPGQKVGVGRSERTLDAGMRLLYEDRSLIVIAKPAGLLSVPTSDTPEEWSALVRLQHEYNSEQIHAVHRLDRDTSGVMVFARGTAARDRLKEMFEKHSLTRQYVALVEGSVAKEKGTWRSDLVELENRGVRSTNKRGEGRPAVTHYEVVEWRNGTTLLLLTLETGRKHQIRVHCKEAGYPIIGDARYGKGRGRLRLHAQRLAFIHPFTQKKLDFRDRKTFS